MDNNLFTKNTEVTKGWGPCPDCGNNDAEYTTRQSYHNGIANPGYYYTIDCNNCNYHEFNYQGPDI